MIINDNELYNDIIDKLINEYNYTREEADIWVNKHGSNIVEEMYDAESNYIANNITQEKINE